MYISDGNLEFESEIVLLCVDVINIIVQSLARVVDYVPSTAVVACEQHIRSCLII